MRWRIAYTDDVDLLRDTAIEAIPNSPPPDAAIVKGAWPGIRSAQESGAGPTGVAWIDSNGWLARLAAARNPGKSIWIDAAPANSRYAITMAEAAAFGARWIVSLNEHPLWLAEWPQITAAARFFADHYHWEAWTPQALIGVLSDFAGPNEFFSQEVLNLLDRAGMHNRVLLKNRLPADPFRGLRAVLYVDREPLPDALRRRIGKMLIEPKSSDDPYVTANDAVTQVSHRYDLVRCWNTGAFASNYLISPDRSKAVVHMIFYADRGPDSASVRVAGKWRTAKLLTIDGPDRSANLRVANGAVEVNLPQVSQYVALQLEA
jgi:hypothetical protein